jgi:alkaline phosphatase
VKTYNNAINWTDLNQSLAGRTIAEYAKANGKAVGTISSVEWSHATPAALGGAHNASRNNYSAIANEMLNAPYLDVIMGAGHPDYNDNGVYVPGGNAAYVGGATTWNQLKNGTHPAGWTLVQAKSGVNSFESLTTGATPSKVVGVAQVATTLQQARSGYSPSDVPYSDASNSSVPTLQTMTQAALNVLDDNPAGLFLHVEGGAVDWANHANQEARMIEEQIDFNQSVQAVEDWVDTHSSWAETLLIVTADHETGLIWGPNSSTTAFQDITNRGAGTMPGVRYNATGHSNSLVPLFARGVGSDLFGDFVDGYDATAAAH